MRIPAATTERLAVRTAHGDLADLTQRLARSAPAPGSGGFRLPAERELELVRTTWRAVQAGALQHASQLAEAFGYEVVRFTDTATGMPFVLLAEREALAGATRRGWGLFVHAPQAIGRDVVEVPHPCDDIYTDQLGVAYLRSGSASDLLVAGASRHALGRGGSDVARIAGSAFDALHGALLAPGRRFVQFHGFDGRVHEGYGDVVLSEGRPARARTAAIAAQLRRAGFDAGAYDGTNFHALGATRNRQAASAHEGSAHFLHVEVGRTIRDEPQRRSALVDALVAAV